MATKRQMPAEYKSACKRLEDLIQDGIKAGCDGLLPERTELYHRITIIRQILEWCHPPLAKTGKQGPYPDGACSRLDERGLSKPDLGLHHCVRHHWRGSPRGLIVAYSEYWRVPKSFVSDAFSASTCSSTGLW
jgi:hypothetical protein